MEKSSIKEVLLGGITNNPIFVMVIGMCPVIAQSHNLSTAFVLGVATAFVLITSNVFISSIRKLLPDGVRIPAFITIVAAMTTVARLFMQSYMHSLYVEIGVFLSLVAVNCIIMVRLESFASKNNPLNTFVDSSSMGLGFIMGISLLGGVRELLIMAGFAIFATAAGGFLALGFLTVLYVAAVGAVSRLVQKYKSGKSPISALSEEKI